MSNDDPAILLEGTLQDALDFDDLDALRTAIQGSGYQIIFDFPAGTFSIVRDSAQAASNSESSVSVNEANDSDTSADSEAVTAKPARDPSEESTGNAEDSDGVDDPVPTCQYCGTECANKAGLASHERACDENPDVADTDTEQTRPCQYCSEEFHIQGVVGHENHCSKNPENTDNGLEADTDKTEADDATADKRYRCMNCDETFPKERSAKNHQNRSNDCAGAAVEPVEQTDEGRTDVAASAADSSADDNNQATDEEIEDEETETADDDTELDPGVGPVPTDRDIVDVAITNDDEPALSAADDMDEDQDVDGDVDEDRAVKDGYEGRHRVRSEPSTIREVTEAPLSGRYLCLDCGFSVSGKEPTSAAKNHDFRIHDSYVREDGREYRQLANVPADELRERWLLIYKDVGSTWTHPKVHEARKNGIIRALREADYFLDLDEIHERLNEMLQSSKVVDRNMSKDELTEDPGYLEELVEKGRIERDGTTWGVDAPKAEQLVATPG